MAVPDIVISQVAKAIGGVVSETTGNGIASASAGAVLMRAAPYMQQGVAFQI